MLLFYIAYLIKGVMHVSDIFQVLVAEVENLIHNTFEQTDEVKALCNEIVQTIREIMMTSPVYK